MVSPVIDMDGRFCDKKQAPDVFFLAGTTGGHADRTCKVPAGVLVAFPLVNLFSPDASDCVTFMASAKGEALLDGRRVEADRIAATPGTVFLVANNPFTGKRAALDASLCGLWVQIEPLTPGAHTLSIRGSSGTLTVSVDYRLTVA